MAEGFAHANGWEAFSAGTKPETHVHPMAVKAMKDLNIDLSNQKPKPLNQFINKSFDIVVTVCDNARKVCPVFTGKTKLVLHHSFYDPAEAVGTHAEKRAVFNKIRDEIKDWVNTL